MVSDERLQFKIAEVQGWTDLHRSPIDHRLDGNSPGSHKNSFIPNWPTDRNASYELPVGVLKFSADPSGDNWGDIKYARAIIKTAGSATRYSAYNESLAWLLYKGWRWVDCAGCGGEGHNWHETAGDETCETCSGEGGEWVHDANEN